MWNGTDQQLLETYNVGREWSKWNGNFLAKNEGRVQIAIYRIIQTNAIISVFMLLDMPDGNVHIFANFLENCLFNQRVTEGEECHNENDENHVLDLLSWLKTQSNCGFEDVCSK